MAPVPSVAVFRSTLLARSETFVRSQALALSRYAPLFVGLHETAGLPLPPERTVILNPGGPGGRVRELAYARLGRAGRLERACRRVGVRVVHAHFGPDGLQALPLARALDVPLVVTFHGYDATVDDDELLRAGGAARAFVQRRDELMEGAARFVAVSGFIRDELLARGFAAEKVQVHHIGIPVGGAPERGARPRTVLFVGRLSEKKGLPDLLDAVARVPDARLVLVGDGPLRAEIEHRVVADGTQVELAGWQDPDGVRAAMTAARVLCVPSRRAATGDAEGLGQVILEAGAVGTPTVGYRHGGIPDAVLDGETGLLADEGDVDGLVRHLTRVLDDDALWETLSTGARRHVETHFDVRRQSATLETLYDEVRAGYDRSVAA